MGACGCAPDARLTRAERLAHTRCWQLVHATQRDKLRRERQAERARVRQAAADATMRAQQAVAAESLQYTRGTSAALTLKQVQHSGRLLEHARMPRPGSPLAGVFRAMSRSATATAAARRARAPPR